ncbi:GvpL/GvpF family gas vesicle protein [bacterium]|nr:GvpL/GvpF family gas vesicle protein [bacterium]
MTQGKYIYGIMDTSEEKYYNLKGIGNEGSTVHSLSFEDVAALVSDSPVKEYPISRENTLKHMKILERFMDDRTFLPVKFGTVAVGNGSRNSEERIKMEVLKARYSEVKKLLGHLRNKVELGLKAIWPEKEMIFKEIVEENKDIQKLKEKISSKGVNQTYKERIKLGRMVKDALDKKRTEEEKKIIKAFQGLYWDLRFNKKFGDKMVTNTAFLVPEDKLKDFDKKIEELDSMYKGEMRFQYIGPVPPCNFVELVVKLEEGQSGAH